MNLQEFKEEKLKEFEEKYGLVSLVNPQGKREKLPRVLATEEVKDFISSSLDFQVALIIENLPKEKEIEDIDEIRKSVAVDENGLVREKDFLEFMRRGAITIKGSGFNAARKEIINYLEKK